MSRLKVFILIKYVEKMHHEWIFKVASIIDRNNINFYQLLSEYDTDGDGFITPDDIRLAFVKLQANLDTNDIENLLNYFNVSHMDRISTREFAKNFMNQNNMQESKNF
jgi:Ca2+-binding EF-hand superfamily protein